MSISFYITHQYNQSLFLKSRFPCRRWFGKDIEDGSTTERLLVAAPYDCSTMSGSDLGSIDPSSHGNGSPAHNTG